MGHRHFEVLCSYSVHIVKLYLAFKETVIMLIFLHICIKHLNFTKNGPAI